MKQISGLTPCELSRRWRGLVSTGTLANWRSAGTGPKYKKIGGKVFYPIAEITKYENRRLKK